MIYTLVLPIEFWTMKDHELNKLFIQRNSNE